MLKNCIDVERKCKSIARMCKDRKIPVKIEPPVNIVINGWPPVNYMGMDNRLVIRRMRKWSGS
jgi:hypothetical protein